MSKTRGEGRSGSEKQQRVLTTPESRKAQADARRAEEQRWAGLSGVVYVNVRQMAPQELICEDGWFDDLSACNDPECCSSSMLACKCNPEHNHEHECTAECHGVESD